MDRVGDGYRGWVACRAAIGNLNERRGTDPHGVVVGRFGISVCPRKISATANRPTAEPVTRLISNNVKISKYGLGNS